MGASQLLILISGEIYYLLLYAMTSLISHKMKLVKLAKLSRGKEEKDQVRPR
jgi:hypothetical protein